MTQTADALLSSLGPLGYDATWIKNHVSDQQVMLSVTRAGLVGFIQDIPLFAKGCVKLRESCWQLADHGEKPNAAFAIRKAIAGARLAPLSPLDAGAPAPTTPEIRPANGSATGNGTPRVIRAACA
jgi:hypothetical protein